MRARERLRLAALVLLALLAACGRGASAPTPAGVTVSGTVTFDLVPVAGEHGIGLDYAATDARPARGVGVELMDASDGAAVLETATTDEQGRYEFTAVSPDTEVVVRVRAEMRSSGAPSWSFSVHDNTAGDALYVLDGTPFSVGSTDVSRDLHAVSGWTGEGYTEPRSAAPFAILDVGHETLELLRGAEPEAQFPPLRIHWSSANAPVFSDGGTVDTASGDIGTTFFSPGLGGLFLLGAEDQDTDEYDRHVIAHELGHYYEWAFSRLDSIGGPHGVGDQLDKRVAFSEGWSNAFAALVTGDTRYVDVFGPGQGAWFTFDVGASAGAEPNPGWFNEFSVHQMVYALLDTDDGPLDFRQVHAVLTGPHRAVDAQASVFSFLHALRAEHPEAAPALEALAAEHAIEPRADAFGAGETNAGHPPHPEALPVYHSLAVNQGARNVCSTDAFGAVNKLASRQFLRFSVDFAASYSLTATATSMPPGTHADPDMVLHRRGVRRAQAEDPPTEGCVLGADPAECFERLVLNLTPGEYVLEVYEWTNTNDHSDDRPPIGRTCFDVEVTQP